MKNTISFFVLIMTIFIMSQVHAQSTQGQKAILVIHGGAGVIEKKYMTPEKEQAYKAALTQALEAGYSALKEGKTCVDAVQAAIRVMKTPHYSMPVKERFSHMTVKIKWMRPS
jgi:beta-aspartyl-peptidase (threonine type)